MTTTDITNHLLVLDPVTGLLKRYTGAWPINQNDVQGLIQPYVTYGENGITKTDTVFRLGGNLSSNTTIGLNTKHFSFSRIPGDTIFRIKSNGDIQIGTTDTIEAHKLHVVGNARIGFLQITNNGNASNTGTGIRIDAVDRPFVFQGSASSTASDMFRFTNWTSDTATSTITNNSKGVVRIYGGFRLPNLPDLSGNVLWITPRYNFTDTAHTTSTTVRGVYYNPTIASMSGVRHIAYENTTGSNLLNTTSGSTVIGSATEEPSAQLAVTSTTKGFLPPRMTGAQAELIVSPEEGLMIYAKDGSGVTITSKGWWGFDGTTWVKLN
jgi:hypothetical protein